MRDVSAITSNSVFKKLLPCPDRSSNLTVFYRADFKQFFTFKMGHY